MTITQIKQAICKERGTELFMSLPMQREHQNVQLPDGTYADPKVIPAVPTKWHRYWENTCRVNVICDDDVMDELKATYNPETKTSDSEMLRYTYKWNDQPKGGGEPYHHYQIIFMKDVVVI